MVRGGGKRLPLKYLLLGELIDAEYIVAPGAVERKTAVNDYLLYPGLVIESLLLYLVRKIICTPWRMRGLKNKWKWPSIVQKVNDDVVLREVPLRAMEALRVRHSCVLTTQTVLFERNRDVVIWGAPSENLTRFGERPWQGEGCTLKLCIRSREVYCEFHRLLCKLLFQKVKTRSDFTSCNCTCISCGFEKEDVVSEAVIEWHWAELRWKRGI